MSSSASRKWGKDTVRTKRKTASLKLSFENEFYSDLSMDRMLYGQLIRSPVAKGIVTSIQTPELPEGYFLFKARDVPGKNIIDTHLGKVCVFSEGNISYLGEPLGILVGPNEKEVSRLVQETEITVDSNTIESYLQSIERKYKRPILKISKDGNLKITKGKYLKEKKDPNMEIVDENAELFSSVIAKRSVSSGELLTGDEEEDLKVLDRIFEDPDNTVVTGCWSNNVKAPDYSEPNGAICSYEKDTLSVWTPTQWLSNIRFALSSSLHINEDNIIIKKTKTNNYSTTQIWYNSIIACQAAVASYRTGRPVKIVFSRQEQENFLSTMLPITIIHKTAVNKDGKLQAMQVDIDMDAGSSNPFAQEILDRLVIASAGPYDPKNLMVTATAYSSSKPSSSIDMELIDAASFFAVENQMSTVADKTSFSPYEFRLMNLQKNDGQSTTTPWAFKIEKPQNLLQLLAQRSDYHRKYASYHLDAQYRSRNPIEQGLEASIVHPMRGIGLAIAFEGSGYYGSELNGSGLSLEITMSNANHLEIYTPPVSHSVQLIWSKLASQILDITQSQVSINSDYEQKDQLSLPENVYSNLSVLTMLLEKCCKELKKKKELGAFPISVKKKISNNSKKVWNNDSFSGLPFHSTSFIAGAMELEIDPCTYREEIRKITLVINAGQILNLKSAESSVKFSIQKMLRSLVENDRVVCKNIDISFQESTQPPCQIGELVEYILPSVYCQALSQALNCTINSLPLRGDSLYRRLLEIELTEKQKQTTKHPDKEEESQK